MRVQGQGELGRLHGGQRKEGERGVRRAGGAVHRSLAERGPRVLQVLRAAGGWAARERAACAGGQLTPYVAGGGMAHLICLSCLRFHRPYPQVWNGEWHGSTAHRFVFCPLALQRHSTHALLRC